MEEIEKEATEFIAACYGAKESGDMSRVRNEIWEKKISNKNITSAPSLRTLPPTRGAFQEHSRRSHFQCMIWLAADQSSPPDVNPLQFGWKLEEGSRLSPVMLPAGTASVPKEVLKLVKCGCTTQQCCSTNRCSCFTAKLSCSSFCYCKGDTSCNNPASKEIDYESDESEDAG